MNILLCGANGFIGRHLSQTLTAQGHHVVRGVRTIRQVDDIAVDYAQDTHLEAWLPRLANIEIVINAVGVLRDTRQQPMAALHSAAPRALFAAAAQAGVRKIIQISALGVDGSLNTRYMRSKGEADAALQTSPLDWTILRPSLVYGADGASAKMFRLLARLPIVGLPGQGEMLVQPVHIDDLASGVLRCLSDPTATQKIIDCAGARVLTYRQMLTSYAQQLGHRAPIFVPIPWGVMRCAAAVSQWLPHSPLEPDTLAMLKAGSSADITAFTALLGRAPRAIDTFIRNTEK